MNEIWFSIEYLNLWTKFAGTQTKSRFLWTHEDASLIFWLEDVGVGLFPISKFDKIPKRTNSGFGVSFVI